MSKVDTDRRKEKAALRAGAMALAVSTLLITLKGFGWLVSGSTTILASLADSVSDAFVSLINYLAIRHSIKPADKDHRYGHGKVEGLAALFQAAFIAAAGFFVFLEAIQKLVEPQPVTEHFLLIGIMLVSLVLTIFLIRVQTRSMNDSKSLAVEADRAHYLGDTGMNLSVIGIVVADMLGAPFWVDPVGGILLTVYLGHTAWHVAAKGIDMLLDRELGGDVREQILTTIMQHKRVEGVHDLRTRRNGMKIHIAFDIEVDPNMLLCDAHKICKDLEESLLKDFPHAEIMIHKDPVGDTDDSRHQVKGLHHA